MDQQSSPATPPPLPPGYEGSNDLLSVARAQKLLIWAVVAGLTVFITPALYIVAVPFKLYAVYRISKVLGFSMAFRVIYMLCMFVPLLALIFLLMLNAKATENLRRLGVGVGLLGAKRKDLEQTLQPGTRVGIGPAIFVGVMVLVAIAASALNTGPSPYSVVWKGTGDFRQAALVRELEAEADDVNKRLPADIDEYTRCDRVSVGPELRFTYHYSLKNVLPENLSREELAQALAEDGYKEVRPAVCKNMASYLERGVEIHFVYSDVHNQSLATVIVRPEDCAAKPSR